MITMSAKLNKVFGQCVSMLKEALGPKLSSDEARSRELLNEIKVLNQLYMNEHRSSDIIANLRALSRPPHILKCLCESATLPKIGEENAIVSPLNQAIIIILDSGFQPTTSDLYSINTAISQENSTLSKDQKLHLASWLAQHEVSRYRTALPESAPQ